MDYSHQEIVHRIYSIRGQQIMLDSDLAQLYEVPVKRLNEAVNRNKSRFPETFMFQLTQVEFDSLSSQLIGQSEVDQRETHCASRSQFMNSNKLDDILESLNLSESDSENEAFRSQFINKLNKYIMNNYALRSQFATSNSFLLSIYLIIN